MDITIDDLGGSNTEGGLCTTTEAPVQAETPKEALREIAEEEACSLKDLLVLAPQNDPFNCGSDGDLALGQWFAEAFRTHGFQRGVHLRRMHYKLASLEGVTMHDGRLYENTEKCWNYLANASKAARYLGLVDPGDFVDHRNPNPMIFAAPPQEQDEPEWHLDGTASWSLPRIARDLTMYLEVPGIYVSGYDYDDGYQPYWLEAWIEKNTMNDVLEPICREYGVNLVPGLGFQSITGAVNLLKRIEEILEMDRPTRVFYISDFDPAGDCMPVAIARQLQFWLWHYGKEGDVKLKPLALTRAQVEQYNLPRKPIKESDRRREAFENRRGEGAVELDALEAIVPGELGRLFEQAVARYRDLSLYERVHEARYDALATAGEAWDEAIGDVQDRVKEFRAESQRVLRPYAGRLKRLAESMDRDLEPLRERMVALEKTVRRDIEDAANALEVELPDVPEPEIAPGDESDWLYDSTRLYCEQLEVFRNHQKG